MGAQSNNPDVYWRSSVAIPVADRPLFEARAAQLGIKTLGDLTRLFIHGEGVVEALAEPARQLAEKQAKSPRVTVRELTRTLSGMSSDELAKLMALAKQQKTADQAG